MNAADSKIRHFCGSWQGLDLHPHRPWNTKSAPPEAGRRQAVRSPGRWGRAFWGPQCLLQPRGWTGCQELP